MVQLRLEIEHTEALDRWIAERHYLKSTPAGARLRMGFFIKHERVAGMMWGRPVARVLDQERLLELTRLYCVDELPHNTESHIIAVARSYIRRNFPRVKGLIAYASTGQEHQGTVYKGDGWFCLGRRKSGSWANRPNRVDRDKSDKLLWVRSP